MKTLHHIIIITLFMFLSGCVTTEVTLSYDTAIVGVWTGIDGKGLKGSFIFNSDGSADVIKEGISVKETVVRNRATITYRYDPSTTPSTIVLVVKNNNDEVKKIMVS